MLSPDNHPLDENIATDRELEWEFIGEFRRHLEEMYKEENSGQHEGGYRNELNPSSSFFSEWCVINDGTDERHETQSLITYKFKLK